MKSTGIGIVILVVAMVAVGAQADTFGTGANQFTIDFVDIGYAENTSGYGAVGYNYQMGMHEVTIDQFAKARAADSRVGDGNEGYWNDGTRTVGTGGPASYVSAYEGMKFANWLTTGDAYTGAYQFDESETLTAVDRDAAVTAYGTVYVLPTENEWYKAAYLKSDGSAYTFYATGNSIPTAGAGGENYNNVIGSPWNVGSGIAENNGTFDMNGNVWEWNESAFDGTLDNMDETRVLRGGVFLYSELGLQSPSRLNSTPMFENYDVGFRVAAIPEPSSLAMVGLVSGCALFVRRRFMW